MSPWPTRLTGGDGSLTQMTTATGDTLNYTYDALKRLQKVTVKNGSTALFSTAYAYRSVNGNQSSAQVQYRNVFMLQLGNCTYLQSNRDLGREKAYAI